MSIRRDPQRQLNDDRLATSRATLGSQLRLACPVLLLTLPLMACHDARDAPLLAGSFVLAPTQQTDPSDHGEPETGTIERRGISLTDHIARAWGAHPKDVEFTVTLPPGRFDVRARSADGTLEQAEATIRGGLVEALSLQVRRQVRETDVLSLRLNRSGLHPEPVEDGVGLRSPVHAPDAYRGAGAPIDDLVRWIRSYRNKPILDESGLSGLYDIVIEWDPTAGGRAFQTALRDAGFRLVPQKRRYAFLIVEPAP